MALRCGELKETDWRGGKVTAGAITPELIGLLLTCQSRWIRRFIIK
mgnify:FL=1